MKRVLFQKNITLTYRNACRLVCCGLLPLLLTGCMPGANKPEMSDKRDTQDSGEFDRKPATVRDKPIVEIDDWPVARMEDYMDSELERAVDQYESGQQQQALAVISDYARRDNPVALNYMGHYASTDMAGIKDLRLAEDYYRRSAMQGYAPAQHNVGMVLSNDGASQEDLSEAAGWFSLAARQSYAPSLYNLGVRQVTGRGMPVNYDEAIHNFQRAAQLGMNEAKYNLALVYGMTGSQRYDASLCYIWGTLAQEVYAQAAMVVRDCSTQLTSDERSQAINKISRLRASLSSGQ